MSNLTVLIFTSREDLDAGFERAKNLVEALMISSSGAPHKTKLINKLGFILEDLLLVAKYKIVTTPSVVVVDEAGKEVLRLLDLPTSGSLSRQMEMLSMTGAQSA